MFTHIELRVNLSTDYLFFRRNSEKSRSVLKVKGQTRENKSLPIYVVTQQTSQKNIAIQRMSSRLGESQLQRTTVLVSLG